MGIILPVCVVFPGSDPMSSNIGLEKSNPCFESVTFPAILIRFPSFTVFLRYGWLNQSARILPVPSLMSASVSVILLCHVRAFLTLCTIPWTVASRPIARLRIGTMREKSRYRDGKCSSRSCAVSIPSFFNLGRKRGGMPRTFASESLSATGCRARSRSATS